MTARTILAGVITPNGSTIVYKPAEFSFYKEEYTEFFATTGNVDFRILFEKFSNTYPGVTVAGMKQIMRAITE